MQHRSVLADRLSVFALLWAVATLIHQASFTGWISEDRPLGWLLTGLAAGVIIWPRSIPLFATMVAMSAAYTLQRLPNIPNHILFELFVNLTILCGMALGWLEARRQGLKPVERRQRVYSSFASTVRIEVLLLYFFVTLHKLNRDFFDPEVSCGGALFNMMLNRAPALGQASWIQIGCIGATLLFEAGIPLLLLFRKTRALGILTGFLFHLIIGFVPHGGVYSFSALMMTLFFLFTPPEFVESLSRTAEGLLERSPFQRSDSLYRSLAFAGTATTLAVWVWGWQRAGYLSLAKVGFVHWLAWAAFLLFLFLVAFTSEAVTWTGFQVGLLPRPKSLWLLPVLISMNGFSPYLGSKTQTSFAMFSNLRTEDDRPNHLLLGGFPQIWNYQRDIVEIVSSDHLALDRLRQDGLELPYFELQSYLRSIKGDFDVVYRRNGEIMHLQRMVTRILGDSDPLQSPPYLSRKWLRFRPFNAGPKMECRH